MQPFMATPTEDSAVSSSASDYFFDATASSSDSEAPFDDTSFTNAGSSEVQLAAGDTFEILAVSQATAAVSWILTRNGEFVSANRDNAFRYRFVEQGMYMLRGEFINPSDGTRDTLDLTLQVGPPMVPDVGPLGTGDDTGTELVSTDPPRNGNDIRVTSEPMIVTLTPERSDMERMSIDTDGETDANGDGNAFNDDDTGETVFVTDLQPLHVWFAGDAVRDRIITMNATLQNGSVLMDRLYITRGEGAVDANAEITFSQQQDGLLRFAVPSVVVEEGNPHIIEWTFGDGGRSLLEQPTHRYTNDGLYTVQAHVRSLVTGRTMLRAETSITIQGTSNTASGSVSSGNASSSALSDGTSASVLATIWPFLKIALIGLAFIAAFGLLVFAAFTLLPKLRGFTLKDKLATMETAMIQKEKSTSAASIIDVPPPPLAMRKREEGAEPQKPVEPVQEPVDVSKAPDWLKKGYKPEPPVKENVPEPVVEATPVPTPAPAPQKEAEAFAPRPVPPPVQQPTPIVTPTPNVPQPALVPTQEPVSPPPRQQPIMPSVAPVPEPKPEITPVFTPEIPLSAPGTISSTVPSDMEERERERKRRKRQRYRDNLKKRQEQTQATSTALPLVPQIPTGAEEELLLPPASAEHELAPPKPVPPSIIQEIPVMPAVIQEVVAPAIEASPAPTIPQKADTDIAFVIRADSIDPETPPSPPSHQAQASNA